MDRLNQTPDGDHATQEQFVRMAAKVVNESDLDDPNKKRFMKQIVNARKMKEVAGTLQAPRFVASYLSIKDPKVIAHTIFLEIQRNPENKEEVLQDFRKALSVRPSLKTTRSILNDLLLGDARIR